MEDYRPNSKKSREDDRKDIKKEIPVAGKVVESKVRIRKRSGLSKIANTFIAEDLGDIGSRMLFERFVPTIKEMAAESFSMMLGVDVRRFDRGGRDRVIRERDRDRDRVSYNRFYEERDRDDRRDDYSRSRVGYEYEDVVIDTRGEVERIFDEMRFYIEEYGMVRVADLCGMLEISSPYTSNDYGWTTLHGMDFASYRGGYVLKLPKPIPLKDRR